MFYSAFMIVFCLALLIWPCSLVAYLLSRIGLTVGRWPDLRARSGRWLGASTLVSLLCAFSMSTLFPAEVAANNAQRAVEEKAQRDAEERNKDHFAIATDAAKRKDWAGAFHHMGLVPKSDKRHSRAQAKIAEYKAAEAAQKKAQAAAQRVAEAKSRVQSAVAAKRAALFQNLGPGEYVTNSGYYVAANEDILWKVARLEGDPAAMRDFFKTGLAAPLPGGIRVVKTGGKLLSGTATIRLPGRAAELWVPREAISNHP